MEDDKDSFMVKESDAELSQEGVKRVVERNNFYRDAFRQVYFSYLVLFVVIVILFGCIFYKYTHPVQPIYIAATSDGKILKDKKLSDPLLSDNEVTQWAADKVRAVFATDFIHWKEQLQSSSQYFTPIGWRMFLQSMKSSRNLDTLESLKMVSEADLTEPPQVERKGIIPTANIFAWNVVLNINVIFTNVNKTIQMPFRVNLVIVRQTLTLHPSGIAINNFIPTALKPLDSNSLV